MASFLGKLRAKFTLQALRIIEALPKGGHQ